MKKILISIISLIFLLSSFLFFFSPTVSAAKCSNDVCNSDKYPASVKSACGCKAQADTFSSVIQNILSAVIAVSGLVAVVFIVIGGINYMTSTGDPGKTKKAKDTILYALIGLIICALAFAIVNWAATTINNSTSNTTNTSTSP
ncbi:hypothetical protein IKG33_00970 [Candidatus Saccharibacteria bacterium]|nr:hypothetical protein [Candidatus Saccharibacteria bacterium]